MDKEITGKEVMERLGMRPYQLFDLCTRGVIQPRDPLYGHRLIDLNTDHGKKIMNSFPKKTTFNPKRWAQKRWNKSHFSSGPPIQKKRIIEQSKILHGMNLIKKNGCKSARFTLDKDRREAKEQIREAMQWLFKKEDVARFEQKHFKKNSDNESSTLDKKGDVKRFFLFSGDYWEVRFDDEKGILKNLERLKYIIRLLESPNTEFDPARLTLIVKGNAPQSKGELSKMSAEQLQKEEGLSLVEIDLDSMPREEKGKLEDAAIMLWERYKKTNSNTDRKNWEKTKDYLLKEYGVICIKNAKGLRFKYHAKAGHQFENARTNVRKNIKNAISDNLKQLPKLADYLKKTIKTGNVVCYNPEESDPGWLIKW